MTNFGGSNGKSRHRAGNPVGDLQFGEAEKLVNEMLELIKEKLEKGEDVLITGLGKFELRDKKSRPGRDPKSKRDYVISARRVVTFHPSKVWRDELNNKI